MKPVKISEVLKAVGGTFLGDESVLQKDITTAVIDSRKIEEKTLFIAIPGERVDGHDFIPQVLQKGALCSISEKELTKECEPYILVSDTKKALRDFAEYYRSILDIKIVGITGSVGKTSTKEMMASVLSEKYCVQKTAGNFNNEIGLPLTIFSIEEKHEVAVVEMGISDFGEMTRLAMIARPDIMVITNIGQCHLENLGTRDGILKAKTECFSYMNKDGEAVLNGMDDKLITVSEVQGKKPHFFDLNCVSEIENLGLAGSNFVLTLDGESEKINVPVAGNHMIINVVAAATVGKLLGMSLSEISKGVSKAKAVAGRGRLIETKKYLLVDDCYNANPVSMKAELDLLKISPGRKVAILGDMFELGENEKELHYEVGSYGAKNCDVMICIGALSENTKNGAFDAKLCEVHHFIDKESFINKMEEILQPGDTVLLKASHGMDFASLLETCIKIGNRA